MMSHSSEDKLIYSSNLSEKKPVSLLTTFSSAFPGKIQTSFQELVNLQDELITLMLENACLDWLHHGFKIESGDLKDNDMEFGLIIKMGEFDTRTRTIVVDNHSFNILRTLMHELAHACIFFIFQPATLAFCASTPHTQQTFFRPINVNFNPSELKLKKCVRDDRKNLPRFDEIDSLFSPEIDESIEAKDFNFNIKKMLLVFELSLFFANISAAYKGDIFDEKSLVEIFPFYMELRAMIMKLAKEYQIEKKYALAVLERYLPRLHDYFETDLKRIIKHRLRDLLDDVGRGYTSAVIHQADKGNDWVYEADRKQVIRGFWHERLKRVTDYSFFNFDSDANEKNKSLSCKL